jgi:hypothetical protein
MLFNNTRRSFHNLSGSQKKQSKNVTPMSSIPRETTRSSHPLTEYNFLPYHTADILVVEQNPTTREARRSQASMVVIKQDNGGDEGRNITANSCSPESVLHRLTIRKETYAIIIIGRCDIIGETQATFVSKMREVGYEHAIVVIGDTCSSDDSRKARSSGANAFLVTNIKTRNNEMMLLVANLCSRNIVHGKEQLNRSVSFFTDDEPPLPLETTKRSRSL